MEDVEELVNKICEKNNYDELLLEIVKKGKESNINRVLEEISNNTKLNDEEKKSCYDKIFDYVEEVNGSFENKIKDIYKKGVKEGLETMLMLSSNGEEKETLKKCLNAYEIIKKEESDMSEKIKIIIADDNVHFCKFIREYLEKYNDIEILGVANSDEDEIKMIEELKPEIVITDLMRNHRYTGLDIIKRYNDDNSKIKFLVISADYKKDVITDGLEVAGYIKKPFNDYKVIYDELKRIKKGINESEYKEWLEKYHNLEVRDINDYFTEEDKKIFEKLEIKLKDKIYTEFECESLYMDFLMYYDDPECDLSEEEKEFQKSLEGTGVTRKEYNDVLKKLERLNENF